MQSFPPRFDPSWWMQNVGGQATITNKQRVELIRIDHDKIAPWDWSLRLRSIDTTLGATLGDTKWTVYSGMGGYAEAITFGSAGGGMRVSGAVRVIAENISASPATLNVSAYMTPWADDNPRWMELSDISGSKNISAGATRNVRYPGTHVSQMRIGLFDTTTKAMVSRPVRFYIELVGGLLTQAAAATVPASLTILEIPLISSVMQIDNTAGPNPIYYATDMHIAT